MRIKELFIKRYGPLQGISYTLAHPFTLLAGNNEEGKTLTIDALVRLLLGKQVKGFEKIDRVVETPEGYVVIEDDNEGNEIKLPEKGTLTDFMGITSSDCRNIFVIRDSDLSIPGEGEFYTTVTNRLMGLRTAEILRIKETLREIGRLTPGGIFLDVKEENLKTRLDSAAALVDRIEGLTSEMSEGKIDELEEEAVRLQEEIERITLAGEQLEDARKRDKYSKGKEALDRLGSALQDAGKLKKFNEGDAQQWRDGERDIQHYKEEREALAARLKGHEQELKGIEKTVGEKMREFRIFEQRKKTLDEVKAELSLIETKRKEGAEREQKAVVFMRMGIIAALLLAISLIGFIMQPSLLFYIAAPLFFIVTIAFWMPQLQQVRERAWLAGALARIKLTLARFKWKADAAEDIYARLQQFDEELRRRSDEIQEQTRRKENLVEAITELRSKAIPGEEEKIKAAQARIDDIRVRSGVESRQAYQQGLGARQQQERTVSENASILRNRLGAQGETIQDNTAFWQQALKALDRYRDAAPGISYDEAAVTLMKKSKASAEAGLAGLLDRMAGFRKRLEEVEREANKIMQSEADYLPCATMIDLEAVRDKLREFINSHEETRDTVLKVMAIFEEIEAEERKKVAELFGPGSPVSHYFDAITNNRYEAVLFNEEEGCIEVRHKDGHILAAEKLSGGAYDQLYLAIRLALGEKILQGTKGFFIMDDPFVKADPERLQRQIEVLKMISESGWQIIYFSAKGEMRELTKPLIKRGAINYVEIQAISS
jgi:DNA repair exonuclease SbcCD ATPase subunit